METCKNCIKHDNCKVEEWVLKQQWKRKEEFGCTWFDTKLSSALKSKFTPADAKRLLAIRDALVQGDSNEAYHQLYSIVSPNFDVNSDEMWVELENIANKKSE